ncbi:MAG: WG repeat-containing protein [Bacteroidota bacterium]
MRFLLILLALVANRHCLCQISSTNSPDDTIIDKQDGNITLLNLYDEVGWSNLEYDSIISGVIGVKLNGKWGLSNSSGKLKIDPYLHAINPLKDDLFITSVAGKFSNVLFYGVVDETGKQVIPNLYFSLKLTSQQQFIASEFTGNRVRFGLLSTANQRLTEFKYEKIIHRKYGYKAYLTNSKFDLLTSTGEILETELDSIACEEGCLLYKDGFCGYLNKGGAYIHPLKYKKIAKGAGFIDFENFQTWQVYEKSTMIFSCKADSISQNLDGTWTAFRNGVYHYNVEFPSSVGINIALEATQDQKKVIRNLQTQKWSLLEDSVEVLFNCDSIYLQASQVVFTQNRKFKFLTNPQVKFDEVLRGLKGQFIVRKNEYWGIIENNGDVSTTIKYDQISCFDSNYKVKYLGKFGILDRTGSWRILPIYDAIEAVNGVLFARKGRKYEVFNERGEFVHEMTSPPRKAIHQMIVIENDSSQFGLLDSNGYWLLEPSFQYIKEIGDHVLAIDSSKYLLLDSLGNIVFQSTIPIESIAGMSEDLIAIKLNGKWGFIDKNESLVIGNRYDSALLFSEGLAGVMINGKWGFIDKNENIIIQPYYQTISPFENGLAILEENNQYVLVNRTGGYLLNQAFENIQKTKYGKYILTDSKLREGITDQYGRVILSPFYSRLEDFGDLILTKLNGKYGLIDSNRKQLFKNEYNTIKLFSSFIVLGR